MGHDPGKKGGDPGKKGHDPGKKRDIRVRREAIRVKGEPVREIRMCAWRKSAQIRQNPRHPLPDCRQAGAARAI
jgi:hypothetical protein